MNQEKIDRINFLARKQKSEGLTEVEKKEQKNLREEYIAKIRANFRAQMHQIDVINEDGSKTNLGQAYDEKQNKN